MLEKVFHIFKTKLRKVVQNLFNLNDSSQILSVYEKRNDLFHHYYKTQFNWNDDETQQFYNKVSSELPSTFRVSEFRQESQEILWLLKSKYLDKNSNLLCKALLWYPREMAWQISATNEQIRVTPELKWLHNFLLSETDCGFISRQEAVSMIPSLLLDVESHHKILDICAAPGSKTAQLIEMLHSKANSIPTGIVVANDNDISRCYTMIHQLQRLNSPCFIVVRHDATLFPNMYLPDSSSETGQSQMLFDRILADVPCTGDGTLRKNPALWSRWNPNQSIQIHYLQIKILRRSLEMLKVGGRVVYSTCSLNPIENEAVIAATLSQCQGSVRLVDVSDRLTELVTKPGLSSWRVMLKDKTWCSSPDDVPSMHRPNYTSSMFPPVDATVLGLQRCIRIHPHLQNTGGFFIAVLDKVADLPWSTTTIGSDQESGRTSTDDDGQLRLNRNKFETLDPKCHSQCLDSQEKPQNLKKQQKCKASQVFKEDPFFFLEDGNKDWDAIKCFYGISDNFPHRQLLFRNLDGRRHFYYFTNDIGRQLIDVNHGHMNVVMVGLKVFSLLVTKSFEGYRLLQDAVELLDPFIGADQRRITVPTRADLLCILGGHGHLSSVSDQLADTIRNVSVGPVLCQYYPDRDTIDGTMPRIPLTFAGLITEGRLFHCLSTHQRSHLLRICGDL